MDEPGESARIGDVSGTSSGYERSPTFKRQSKTSPYGRKVSYKRTKRVQVVRCKSVDTFSLTDSQLGRMKPDLLNTDQDAAGLAKVKDRALKKLPSGAFTCRAKVRYVKAGPGCGKSNVIRTLADENDLILAPFTKLKADYEGLTNTRGERYDLTFKTTHRAMETVGHRRIFVDEFTSFSYDFLACVVFNNAAEEVFLVGDHKQTRIQEPNEGLYIGNYIDLPLLDTHELLVNFRSPPDSVPLLNRMFGYEIRAHKKYDGVPSISFVDSAEDLPPAPLRMCFSKEGAKKMTETESNTVRANQGGMHRDVVALSRHTHRLIVVLDTSEAAGKFRGKFDLGPDWVSQFQTYLKFEDDPAPAFEKSDELISRILGDTDDTPPPTSASEEESSDDGEGGVGRRVATEPAPRARTFGAEAPAAPEGARWNVVSETDTDSEPERRTLRSKLLTSLRRALMELPSVACLAGALPRNTGSPGFWCGEDRARGAPLGPLPAFLGGRESDVSSDDSGVATLAAIEGCDGQQPGQEKEEIPEPVMDEVLVSDVDARGDYARLVNEIVAGCACSRLYDVPLSDNFREHPTSTPAKIGYLMTGEEEDRALCILGGAPYMGARTVPMASPEVVREFPDWWSVDPRFAQNSGSDRLLPCDFRERYSRRGTWHRFILTQVGVVDDNRRYTVALAEALAWAESWKLLRIQASGPSSEFFVCIRGLRDSRRPVVSCCDVALRVNQMYQHVVGCEGCLNGRLSDVSSRFFGQITVFAEVRSNCLGKEKAYNIARDVYVRTGRHPFARRKDGTFERGPTKRTGAQFEAMYPRMTASKMASYGVNSACGGTIWDMPVQSRLDFVDTVVGPVETDAPAYLNKEQSFALHAQTWIADTRMGLRPLERAPMVVDLPLPEQQTPKDSHLAAGDFWEI
ncbi:hypothetical protein J6590_066866 [Homalodisca vitripennis]|nr:hypothetical protein J6590_066866 [Homalodisca vitripennis]